jgi:O-antigen ligase
MMAFLERKDMPRSIMGIPGFNLWNLLCLNVVGAWLTWRRREGLDWFVPRPLSVAFLLYLFVIFWAFVRLLIDPTEYYESGRQSIVLGYLINPLKFLLPGIMIYDGCRSRERVGLALGAIVLTYGILAVFVIRYMGLGNLSGDELSDRAARVIQRDVGYHRVDMSMMLAGASWAVFALSRLTDHKLLRLGIWAAAGVVLVAQALTGGRAGYVTWGVVGLSLCLLKWRSLLPLIPVAILAVVAFLPGVRERMLSGFAMQDTGSIVAHDDASEITSGRNNAWPYVLGMIAKNPLIGYGRLAMARTGISTRLLEEQGEVFGHPHNAYLEMLLDNGIIGFACVVPIFWILLGHSVTVFRGPEDRLFEVAGAIGLALLLALLVASMGAQTLYPREGMVGMWAALGVAARVWIERKHDPTADLEYRGESPGCEAKVGHEPCPADRYGSSFRDLPVEDLRHGPTPASAAVLDPSPGLR